jgi:MoaA/NifB/PqqE/SkfB family radical SAM enzyme
MEYDFFRRILDEWAPYLRYLSFDGPGETIMNPETFKMIRYAKSRGIRVMLSTNATLLSRENTDAVLDSGVDLLIFSVNGASKEVYEAVHGGGNYEKTLENIRRFLKRKLARRAPVMVSLQMVLLPETLPQAGVFYRQWQREPGVDSVRVKKDVVCNEGACLEDNRRRRPRRNPCSRLWHGPVFVETNGDVYASPGVLYKAAPIGNLKDHSLAEIWNGDRIQAMRLAHSGGDISSLPECVDCAYPRPLLPLIIAGFLVDPFSAGKLMPVIEKLAFWYRFPLFEKIGQWR